MRASPAPRCPFIAYIYFRFLGPRVLHVALQRYTACRTRFEVLAVFRLAVRQRGHALRYTLVHVIGDPLGRCSGVPLLLVSGVAVFRYYCQRLALCIHAHVMYKYKRCHAYLLKCCFCYRFNRSARPSASELGTWLRSRSTSLTRTRTSMGAGARRQATA